MTKKRLAEKKRKVLFTIDLPGGRKIDVGNDLLYLSFIIVIAVLITICKLLGLV